MPTNNRQALLYVAAAEVDDETLFVWCIFALISHPDLLMDFKNNSAYIPPYLSPEVTFHV
jgi:hypothetical protein